MNRIEFLGKVLLAPAALMAGLMKPSPQKSTPKLWEAKDIRGGIFVVKDLVNSHHHPRFATEVFQIGLVPEEGYHLQSLLDGYSLGLTWIIHKNDTTIRRTKGFPPELLARKLNAENYRPATKDEVHAFIEFLHENFME